VVLGVADSLRDGDGLLQIVESGVVAGGMSYMQQRLLPSPSRLCSSVLISFLPLSLVVQCRRNPIIATLVFNLSFRATGLILLVRSERPLLPPAKAVALPAGVLFFLL